MDRGPIQSVLGGTGDTFFERGFISDKGGPTANMSAGVPASGSTFTSLADPFHTYRMPIFGSANPDTGQPVFSQAVLDNGSVLPSDRSATLSFATPQAFTALSVLLATGNGTNPIDMIVNYVGGASVDLGNITAPDWFGSGTIAYATGGRFDIANDRYDNIGGSGQPDLFSADVALTDTATPVASVTFNYAGTTTGAGTTAIFAVSGGTTVVTNTAVPEPASLAIAAAAAAGLTTRRRRR